jgi:ABC-type methionine transport system ATPase subunit
MTGRYWLIFEGDSAKRPVLCDLAKKFDITFNIRQSSVTDAIGLIAVQLEGERGVVKDAIRWLEEQGVRVDPVELQTIEG